MAFGYLYRSPSRCGERTSSRFPCIYFPKCALSCTLFRNGNGQRDVAALFAVCDSRKIGFVILT
jgi:hypothetical protein